MSGGNLAVIRREAEISKKIDAARAAQRVMAIKREYDEKADKLVRKVETAVGGAKMAIATNGAARVGGMALEVFLSKKLSADQAKYVGPASVAGAIIAYTLGMSAKSSKEQHEFFVLAGLCEGAASAFLLDQMRKAI